MAPGLIVSSDGDTTPVIDKSMAAHDAGLRTKGLVNFAANKAGVDQHGNQHIYARETPHTDIQPALMHRNLTERPLLIDSASGSWLHLTPSSSFSDNYSSHATSVLDACGGAAVAVIGHAHPEVIGAMTAQLHRVAYVHTAAYTTSSAEQLASFLLEDHGSSSLSVGNKTSTLIKNRQNLQGINKNPFGFTRCWLGGSGSEAMEAAMKLARQYFFEREGHDEASKGKKKKWIVRKQGYHGNTVGAMSISGNVSRRVPYEGAMVLPPGESVRFVSPAFAFRGRLRKQEQDKAENGEAISRNNAAPLPKPDGQDTFAESEAEYTARLIQEIDDEILDAGPETVIAFVAETMVGATTGCVTAPQDYFAGVRKVCDKYGILMILDEVMCGAGRTGTYFAFEQEGLPEAIRPDMVVVGKGLGGGYAPLSGVLIHDGIVQVLRQGSASFNHGHTHQAHAAGCAAGLTVQQIIRRDGLVEACAQKGVVLGNLLREAFSERRYVGDVRGRGLFWAVEFVADRRARKPFPRSVSFAPRLQARALELGLAVYPGQGTADGVLGDHVLLAPPLNITDEELWTVVRRLEVAYDDIEKEIEKGQTAKGGIVSVGS